MKADFKLRCCVRVRDSDVRALTSVMSREGSFLSGFTDSKVSLWSPKTDSNEFEEQKILTASGHPVSALCVLPPSDGETLGLIAIASSNDHIIRIYRTDETNPLYQLQGHTDTVNAVTAGKFSLVTGSSDHTARLWVKEKCLITLQEHEGIVWSVAVMRERAYIFTASEDKTVRMWKAGKCERIFHGHTAGVRCVVVLNAVEIMSCSDDGTVRRWNTSDGTCTQTCGTQTTAILAVASLPDIADFVSCAADHTLQIWRGQTLKQTVALPEPSLPLVCVLSDGDLVTSTCSGTICVFTSDVKRMASEVDQQAFKRLVTKLETNVSPEAASCEPCFNTASKQLYQGREYDFVFDVELYKDRSPLKLPYNVGDDPQLAARNFLQQNEVDERFLETVTSFILSHTSSRALAAAASTVSDVSTGAVSKTKSSVSQNLYFPETKFLSFEQRNLQQIFEKIREFNNFAVRRGGQEFPDNNISLVERLVRGNEWCSAAADVLWQMLQWPDALLFPVLDVLRFLVLQSAGNEHFVKHDQFVEYACTQLHCQSHPKNQLVMLRVLCNMFQHTAGERFIAQHSERLLSTALSELHESAEINIQVALSTFVLNLTISSRSANDLDGVRRCLKAAAQLSQTQSDSEAHFRLLVIIGTAVSAAAAAGDDDGGGDNDTDDETGQSFDLDNFLHWCRVDGTDKTSRCSQLLAELLTR